MISAAIIAALTGVFAVLQAGLNRAEANQWGLAGAALLNSIVFVVFASLFLLVVKKYPSFVPEFVRDSGSFKTFSWWYVFPGLLGFLIVLGIPFAITKIGALNAFLAIVGAQMVASIVWDIAVEGIPASPVRVAGAVVAWTGVLIAAWKR